MQQTQSQPHPDTLARREMWEQATKDSPQDALPLLKIKSRPAHESAVIKK